ncbi:hypothetical protein Hanom_Chr06g00536861 [Helianthus anomalus]
MGKPPCGNRTQDLLVAKPYLTPKMPLGYKAMGMLRTIFEMHTKLIKKGMLRTI